MINIIQESEGFATVPLDFSTVDGISNIKYNSIHPQLTHLHNRIGSWQ